MSGPLIFTAPAEEAEAALRAGGEMVSCSVDGAVSGWRLESALDLIGEAESCSWMSSWDGHDLHIVTGGRCYAFKVRSPHREGAVS